MESELGLPAHVAALRASEALLAAALDSVSEGSLISDARRRTIYCNRTFTTMTGYDIDDILGESCRILQGPETDPSEVRRIRDCLDGGGTFRGRVLNYRRDGSTFWNQLTISPVKDDAGIVTHFVSVQRDVTEEVRRELDLGRRASLDELTGLPRRGAVLAALDAALAEAQNTGAVVGLGVIEISGFMALNHRLGYPAGDAILRELAERMSLRTRSEDTLGRLSGGRFLLVATRLDERSGKDLLRGILERLLESAAAPVAVNDGESVSVAVRYGFAMFPRDAGDAHGMLRLAERSLRAATSGSRSE